MLSRRKGGGLLCTATHASEGEHMSDYAETLAGREKQLNRNKAHIDYLVPSSPQKLHRNVRLFAF